MAKGIKTGGRTKGTPNIISSKLKSSLNEIAINEIDKVPELLNELNPKERLEMFVKLLPYIIPKQSEIIESEPTEVIILRDIE